MSWYIQVQLRPPHAAIAKDARYSGVQIGGETKTPGGPYPVRKGDPIYVYATVENDGEQTGSLWAAIIDNTTGEILASTVSTVAPGGTFGIPLTQVIVEHDMEIYIAAGVGSKIDVANATDTWGC